MFVSPRFSPPSEIISSSCPIQNRSYNMQHEPDSMLKKKKKPQMEVKMVYSEQKRIKNEMFRKY